MTNEQIEECRELGRELRAHGFHCNDQKAERRGKLIEMLVSEAETRMRSDLSLESDNS